MQVSKLLSRSVLFAAGLGAGLPAMGRDDVPRSASDSRQGASQQRVLIVSATDNLAADQGIALATEALEKQGVAYDRFVATQGGEIQSNQQLGLESSDGAPRYSAIVLTNDKLLFENNQGLWVSGLSTEQWSELQTYEAKNQVKRLSLYSSPSQEIGMAPVGQATGDATQLEASQEASIAMPGIAQVGQLQLANAWRYPAQVTDQSIAKPILYFNDISTQEGQKSVAAALVKTQDGREQMHFFFSQGKNIEVSKQLAPLWIEWLIPNEFKGEWASVFSGHEAQTGKMTIGSMGQYLQVGVNLGQTQFAGPAVLVAGRLLAAWNVKGQDIGIATLESAQQGGMVGTMLNGSSNPDQGSVSIPEMSLDAMTGKFNFTAQTEALGSMQGTVEVVAKGETYDMSFKVQEFTFKGIAIRTGDQIVVAIANGKNFGVAEYTMQESVESSMGQQQLMAQGRWARIGVEKIFAQTLTRIVR